LLDAASKKLTWVTDLQWETTPFGFSPDGKQFSYLVNEDGRTELYLEERATMQAHKLNFPEGVSSFGGNPSEFSASGDRLLVEHQSSQSAPAVWVYNLLSGRSQQITPPDTGMMADDFPASHLVHYRSFDGKIISAFIWLPFNLKRDGSHPGIVLPHGGPTGQTVDSFNRTAAALATRGYICIAPNPRGSTGYGLAFQKANYQDLGGGDLQDEVFAAKFLTSTGYVNERKIGITGGSYGGYMTLMAIGKTPAVWSAAVEEYGIIDWLTMLQHEDPRLQEYEKSLLGDPAKDRTVYENDSPIKHLRNCRAPLLVLQGDNDIRVPKEEAQQVVSILDKAGKTVDAHYYPNEGHGFMKRENQIDAMQRTIDWFNRYLMNQPGL
jgi:dipeptidyl aminopeptidase/acylaminoacyl peptidase